MDTYTNKCHKIFCHHEKSTHSLIVKWMSPKLLSLGLSHPVGVTLKTCPWKHALQLPQHVTEQQGQFGQVPPENDRYSRLSVMVCEIELDRLCSEMIMFPGPMVLQIYKNAYDSLCFFIYITIQKLGVTQKFPCFLWKHIYFSTISCDNIHIKRFSKDQ